MASSLVSNRRLDPADAFDLSEAWKRGALRVSSPKLLNNAFELGRGEEHPSEPLVFVRDEGRTAHDLIATTYATLTLASERLLGVLREHGYSGWATFPVEIISGEGEQLHGYEGLAVTGRCGPIDDQLSEEIILPPPVPSGQACPGLRGLCFSPDSWDGSDVFTSEDRASIFVTEPVMRTLQEAKLTNIAFQRLAAIERPILPD